MPLCLAVLLHKLQIDDVLAYGQSFESELRHPVREYRIDVELACGCVCRKAEDRLQEVKDSTGGPTLRDVGTTILHRKIGAIRGDTSP